MNYWIAVASREHVQRGKKEGIAQVCHGKQSPLQRMKPGDWIVYYSPKTFFATQEPCRRFTAIGQIRDGEPYRYTMSADFIPWRRDVAYVEATEVPIEPLLNDLSFIKNKKQWGMYFRYGVLKIPVDDFKVIALHMGVTIDE